MQWIALSAIQTQVWCFHLNLFATNESTNAHFYQLPTVWPLLQGQLGNQIKLLLKTEAE